MTAGDEDLRRRFRALRDADRAGAPPFDALVRGALASGALASDVPASGARVRRRWALAGAVGVATAVVLYAGITVRRARQADRWAAAGAEIARWRAPTDSLLGVPGRALLTDLPALGTSVLDTIIPLPRPTPRGD